MASWVQEMGVKVLNLHQELTAFVELSEIETQNLYQMIHSRIIIIPLLAVMFLVMAGCHHDSATMQELARIDSMVYHQGEREGLPLLQQMDIKDFNNEEKSYHSLLLTMAQYKCYQPFTSDSVISEVVDYYRKSGDKVKYLKALVAQGCVLEDLGNPDKAVEVYHQAEIIRPIADTAMTAYAKLRLAVLYQENIVGAKTIAVEKYKEALDLYRFLNDKHYQMLCLSIIGAIYRDYKDKERQDSCLFFIDSATELAKEMNDTYFQFETLFMKAEFFELVKFDYRTAKNLVVQAIKIGGKEIDHPRAHFCAAKSYIKLGQRDSALYYLNHAPAIRTYRDSIMYFKALSEIALFDKDTERWVYYYDKANGIADSVLIHSLNHRLRGVEKKYDVQLAVLNRVQSEARLNQALLLAALLALALFALAFLVWRYKNQLKMRQNEVEMLKADLDGSLHSLQQMQARLDSQGQDDEGKVRQSDELRAIINQQISAVHQLMEWSYQYDSEKFAAKFKEMMTVPGVSDDSNYWSHLQSLVNELHDNVLVKAQEEAGGALTETELNLLALYCCGFSRTVIMVTMGYRSIGTVYNKKITIAKKLHVRDLDEFVRRHTA